MVERTHIEEAGDGDLPDFEPEESDLVGDVDPEPEVHSISNPDTVDSGDLVNTLAFWLFFIAIIFVVGRYSDTIMATARRFFSSSADED